MSGSLRMLEIVRILREAGHTLTFLAYTETAPKYQRILEDLGVECVSDANRALRKSADAMRCFLISHDFEVAILSMYNCYNRYASYIRSALPKCRLVFDTTDLASLRCKRQAEIEGTAEAFAYAEQVKAEETAALKDADSIWTVSEEERKLVSDLIPGSDVRVVGNIHRIEEVRVGFQERKGLAFIGSYGHAPNIDGVRWFMKYVFPIIKNRLPDVEVSIIGPNPPEDFHEYAKHYAGVRVTGYVEDHRSILSSSRVGIAPLRFGAGVKGKIAEYFCCGLPCVSTTIGIEGMNLIPGKEVLVGDTPEDFAGAVIQAYTNPDIWLGLSESGVEYVMRELSIRAVAPRLLAAVESASRIKKKKHKAVWGNILWCIRNPRKLNRWVGLAISTLRQQGAKEMIKQLRVWLHRPKA